MARGLRIVLTAPRRALRAYARLLAEIRAAERDGRCVICDAAVTHGRFCERHHLDHAAAP